LRMQKPWHISLTVQVRVIALRVQKFSRQPTI
jgi:hypothetical protein